MSEIRVDLDAITSDIELAGRSAEMARHVALDHGPELVAEVRRLAAVNERWASSWQQIVAANTNAWGELLEEAQARIKMLEGLL